MGLYLVGLKTGGGGRLKVGFYGIVNDGLSSLVHCLMGPFGRRSTFLSQFLEWRILPQVIQ